MDQHLLKRISIRAVASSSLNFENLLDTNRRETSIAITFSRLKGNLVGRSIREEVERLKQEFDQLCSAGKVSSEIRVMMNSMLVIVELKMPD